MVPGFLPLAATFAILILLEPTFAFVNTPCESKTVCLRQFEQVDERFTTKHFTEPIPLASIRKERENRLLEDRTIRIRLNRKKFADSQDSDNIRFGQRIGRTTRRFQLNKIGTGSTQNIRIDSTNSINREKIERREQSYRHSSREEQINAERLNARIGQSYRVTGNPRSLRNRQESRPELRRIIYEDAYPLTNSLEATSETPIAVERETLITRRTTFGKRNPVKQEQEQQNGSHADRKHRLNDRRNLKENIPGSTELGEAHYQYEINGNEERSVRVKYDERRLHDYVKRMERALRRVNFEPRQTAGTGEIREQRLGHHGRKEHTIRGWLGLEQSYARDVNNHHNQIVRREIRNHQTRNRINLQRDSKEYHDLIEARAGTSFLLELLHIVGTRRETSRQEFHQRLVQSRLSKYWDQPLKESRVRVNMKQPHEFRQPQTYRQILENTNKDTILRKRINVHQASAQNSQREIQQLKNNSLGRSELSKNISEFEKTQGSLLRRAYTQRELRNTREQFESQQAIRKRVIESRNLQTRSKLLLDSQHQTRLLQDISKKSDLRERIQSRGRLREYFESRQDARKQMIAQHQLQGPQDSKEETYIRRKGEQIRLRLDSQNRMRSRESDKTELGRDSHVRLESYRNSQYEEPGRVKARYVLNRHQESSESQPNTQNKNQNRKLECDLRKQTEFKQDVVAQGRSQDRTERQTKSMMNARRETIEPWELIERSSTAGRRNSLREDESNRKSLHNRMELRQKLDERYERSEHIDSEQIKYRHLISAKEYARAKVVFSRYPDLNNNSFSSDHTISYYMIQAVLLGSIILSMMKQENITYEKKKQ